MGEQIGAEINGRQHGAAGKNGIAETLDERLKLEFGDAGPREGALADGTELGPLEVNGGDMGAAIERVGTDGGDVGSQGEDASDVAWDKEEDAAVGRIKAAIDHLELSGTGGDIPQLRSVPEGEAGKLGEICGEVERLKLRILDAGRMKPGDERSGVKSE
jgi:hypothetical protein